MSTSKICTKDPVDGVAPFHDDFSVDGVCNINENSLMESERDAKSGS